MHRMVKSDLISYRIAEIDTYIVKQQISSSFVSLHGILSDTGLKMIIILASGLPFKKILSSLHEKISPSIS